MVRVEEGESTLIRLTQHYLVRHGTKRLDALYAMCPKCGEPLDGVPLTSEQWDCPKCKHSQKGLSTNPDGSYALGSVAGVGVVALLRWLHEHDEGPKGEHQ